MEEIFIFIQR
jgi:hypothetical protein